MLVQRLLVIHPVVGVLGALALHVGGQSFNVVATQELPRGHQRVRPRVARVGEVRQVPVVGVLAALLREVRTGAFGAQDRRQLPVVVARLRDALALPVDRAGVQRVAVAAPVGDVQVQALLLGGRQRPPGVVRTGLVVQRRRGQENHDRRRRPEHQQTAEDQDGRGHLHATCTSCGRADSTGRPPRRSSAHCRDRRSPRS